MSLPTAPFHEHFVASAVREFAGSRPEIQLSSDEFGNLSLLYDGGQANGARRERGGSRNGRRRRYLAVTAHMDHPGMAFAERLSARDFLFERLGGVPVDLSRDRYALIYSIEEGAEQTPVAGRITSYVDSVALGTRKTDTACFRLRVKAADAERVGPGSFAMLDLAVFELGKRRLRCRACDDLAGVAVALAFLDQLRLQGSPVRAAALLTRAEETGFGGMMGAATSGILDHRAMYVNIECSNYRAGAPLGRGPVVRVGDRVCVFDPSISGGLTVVAERLAQGSRGQRPFRYQRKLMDGGSCEATILYRAGYDVGAVALPLRNYHNAGKKEIRAEVIHLDDAVWLIELLVSLALQPDGMATALKAAGNELDRRMKARYRPQARRLRQHPLG